MYAPRFVITNNILKNIGQVEAAKEVIENAPLVPAYEKNFQTDAIVRTVYHGTHIEGNDLTLSQTKQILEGEEVYGRDRDVQEVINYRNVVKLLEDLKEKRGGYDTEVLKEIHAATVYRVIPEEKTGVLRQTKVVIKEEGTDKIIFTPPNFIEVPYLLHDFFEWLNASSQEVHPILKAGIAHYVLVAIHPFVEGNGRTARALATLVLLKESYDIKRFFALEEHFDKDLAKYYEVFFQVDTQSEDISERDLTPWLEYFTEVVAVELNKIKEKVRKLSIDSRMKLKIGEQVALSVRQMKLIEYLQENGFASMKDLRDVLTMVSDDTILRDLNNLQSKGIIEKEGSTKAARYVLKK